MELYSTNNQPVSIFTLGKIDKITCGEKMQHIVASLNEQRMIQAFCIPEYLSSFYR